MEAGIIVRDRRHHFPPSRHGLASRPRLLRTLVLALWTLAATFPGEARSDSPESQAACWIRSGPHPGAPLSKTETLAEEVLETEPNDTPATANPIAGFGTAPGKASAVDVLGGFDLAPPAGLPPLSEDEGSIPLATPTGLAAGQAVRVNGHLGDGPFGSAGAGSGDFDFYAVTGVSAGQVLRASARSASRPRSTSATSPLRRPPSCCSTN